MKIFIKGSAKPVELTPREFVASGGQGAIYVRGGTAYKVFGEFVEKPPKSGNLVFVERPEWAMPQKRIDEIAKLNLPAAVKPLTSILDSQNNVIGHTMRAVTHKYVLTATIPVPFRLREKLTQDHSLRFVRTIQDGIDKAHAQGFKLGDIQVNNFLVSERFDDIAMIDVDSWATPSFRVAALLDTARDWPNCPVDPPEITELTDWFSFGMVAFEIFVGIHPFRGTCPGFAKRDVRKRMEARISVLNPKVSGIPADATLPISSIPSAYSAWFEALFEKGARVPPPMGPVETIQIAAVVQAQVAHGKLLATLLFEYSEPIVEHLPGMVSVGATRLFMGGRKLTEAAKRGACYMRTPKAETLLRLHLGGYDSSGMRTAISALESGVDVRSSVSAHDAVNSGGFILLRIGDQLSTLDLFEGQNRVLVSTRQLAGVSENGTQLFWGCALHNVLGAPFAVLVPDEKSAYSVRLLELLGHRILDARFERSVLQVVTEKAGEYFRHVYRFSNDFSERDHRSVEIAANAGLNFAVLDTGVCAQINEEGQLEVFGGRPGGPSRVVDLALGESYRLYSDGSRLLGVRGASIYQLKLN